MIRLMLGRLLEGRFHLEVKRLTREMPVYTVVTSTRGLKLEPAKLGEKDCNSAEIRPAWHQVLGGQARGLHAKAATVEDLAKFIEHWSDRPIIDRTRLVNSLFWAPLPVPHSNRVVAIGRTGDEMTCSYRDYLEMEWRSTAPGGSQLRLSPGPRPP